MEKDALVTYETILVEQNGGILTITLNRPDKLNAFTDTMLDELTEAFKKADGDASVRVVVLTGAGRGFCPGQDLAAAVERGAGNGTFSYSAHLRGHYNPLILGMRGLSKPIIAAINGVAAGAGMSLALACDYRIAADSASFIQAFVKVGLVPDSGSTWMLPRLIGMTRALDMMLSGRKVSAQEALEMGLVSTVVPNEQLMETVNKLAQEFANAPTKTIGLIKQAVEFASNSTLEEALNNEADLQDKAAITADHTEGISAFLEKRPAQFQGK
ncbi:MAG: enoyl-CoA hydratase/isomerase family protein [Anaerolineae bacterium]|nr:enoyl-CoA hydratase/isomerase family protein [Anaerolineae bacterium]